MYSTVLYILILFSSKYGNAIDDCCGRLFFFLSLRYTFFYARSAAMLLGIELNGQLIFF